MSTQLFPQYIFTLIFNYAYLLGTSTQCRGELKVFIDSKRKKLDVQVQIKLWIIEIRVGLDILLQKNMTYPTNIWKFDMDGSKGCPLLMNLDPTYIYGIQLFTTVNIFCHKKEA